MYLPMPRFDGDQSKCPFKFHRPCSKISDIKHKTTQKELTTFLKNHSYFRLKVIFKMWRLITAWGYWLNTSYLTNSYILFTLKMESTILGIKMTVKSGLQKICLKFLHAEAIFLLTFYLLVSRKITNSVTKITIFQHEEKLEIVFFCHMYLT